MSVCVNHFDRFNKATRTNHTVRVGRRFFNLIEMNLQ